ncbi:MAG: glycosyltransferase family 2 protein, partial [Helicobacter sp.]|nr:glycosyltransferase family 2 protein [Helicobacter sp.]
MIPIQNRLKVFKPKKKYAFGKYYVISAVYNVEKYLEDYFNSIFKQRLDFKNNIKIICIDDGSTDDSAKIIKKYQSKYPNNIFYLHKENGGQASARNKGLKWLQEHLSNDLKPQTNNRDLASISSKSKDYHKDTKPIWITFMDPDDFLDRDYFYEVDAFLKKHKDEDIAMIGCHYIFYFEKNKAYSDSHPLNHKFQEKQSIKINKALENFIQLSAATAFLKLSKIPKNLEFEEKLKPNFEDAKFINEFLLNNINSQSVFLKNAIYYYRKRADKSSSLDNAEYADKNQVLKLGYLLLLLYAKDKLKTIPSFIQNTIIYDLIWVIKATINQAKFRFHTSEQRIEFHRLFKEIFSLIDTDIILEFNLAGCWWYHKIGILHCFKDEYPPFQIIYIEDF